ncbi:MAG: acyl carrier protein [Hungatella sp.]|nr:acyl carrier protein [Hungatella sp.]
MNIYGQVIRIMAEILKVNEEQIGEDTAIGDIPTWDSLSHLSIISTIEKEFGIQFTPDVVMDLEDVSDFVNAIEDRVGK